MRLQALQYVVRYGSYDDLQEAINPAGMIHVGEEVECIDQVDDCFAIEIDGKCYWCLEFKNRKNQQIPNFQRLGNSLQAMEMT